MQCPGAEVEFMACDISMQLSLAAMQPLYTADDVPLRPLKTKLPKSSISPEIMSRVITSVTILAPAVCAIKHSATRANNPILAFIFDNK